MKNIMVVGGCGAIGSFVVRDLLEKGCNPVAYDIRKSLTFLKDIADKIAVVEGDILDLDALKSAMQEHKIEGVIHLAKILHSTGIPQKDPRRALMVNVLGTANVLEAARAVGIRRVVFSSSKSVFADITGDHARPKFAAIDEDYPKFDRAEPGFIPFYSLTNKMAEYYGIRYAMRFDMEFVILRFGNTWGPAKLGTRLVDEKGRPVVRVIGSLVCALIDSALMGESVSMECGSEEGDDLIYCRDLGDGISRACLSDKVRFTPNHRDVLLASGRLVCLGEVVDAIKRQVPGVDIYVGPDPLPETGHRRMEVVFDITRAKEELGYKPKYDDLDKAIADYIELRRKFS